jgi:hypothetical protein
MPWQECRKMDERMRFVARLLDGEKMATKRDRGVSRAASSTPDLPKIADDAADRFKRSPQNCQRCRAALAQRPYTDSAC